MKLNLNSWHAWLYKNTFQGLPDSLCPYFWKLLVAILLLPITWVGYTIESVRWERNLFFHFLVTFVLYFVLFLGYTIGDRQFDSNIIFNILGGLVMLIITATIFVGPMLGILFLYFWYRDYRSAVKQMNRGISKPKKQYIIVEWWKGFTGKYCPRIDWRQ